VKKKELFTLCALGLALLGSFASAYAHDSDKDKIGPYKHLTTISIPGGLTGFDISWVDRSSFHAARIACPLDNRDPNLSVTVH